VTTVTLTVNDGELNGTASFKVTVTGVNRNDFDGDGLTDLLFQHRDGFIASWFMNGEARKSASFFNPISTGDAGWTIVGNGDFNGDNKTDVLFQYTDGTLAVWYMNGVNQSGSAVVTGNPGADWRAVATADFDGDGKKDILFQNAALGGQMAVWFMDGIVKKSDSLVTPGSPGPGWMAVGAVDFNADGKTDILFKGADGTLAVWFMNGVSQVDTDVLNPSSAGVGWTPVAFGNFDSDPQADIVFQNDDGSLQVWFMRGLNAPVRKAVSPNNAGQDWFVVGPK
jgi:hypothetical protein